MVKTFQGYVSDAETDKPLPGVHVWPVSTRTGGVITDMDGQFHIAIDDGSDAYIQPFAIDLDGYGGGIVSAGKFLDGIDFQLYKTDAPTVVKAKAIVKNHFFGFLIYVALIVLFIHLSKRFL